MTNKKKIFIIAGESSGDLLGSNIMKALKNNDGTWNIRILDNDLFWESFYYIKTF